MMFILATTRRETDNDRGKGPLPERERNRLLEESNLEKTIIRERERGDESIRGKGGSTGEKNLSWWKAIRQGGEVGKSLGLCRHDEKKEEFPEKEM